MIPFGYSKIISMYTVFYVTLGTSLLAGVSAVVGTFFFVQKKSLIGDAASHAMFPGLCLGFFFAGERNPIYLFGGAFITGFLSILVVDLISSKSKIKLETSIAIVLSIFFGMGTLLFSIIQQYKISGQSGLQYFLLGKASSLMKKDIVYICIFSIIILLSIVLFYKEFRLVCFDKSFARSIGYHTNRISLFLDLLVIFTIVLGVQCVGITLMSAMLVTPVAAARYWRDCLAKVICLAGILGFISGFIASLISYVVPSMPTGPCVIVVISLIAFCSFLFSPFKGIVRTVWKRRKYKIKMEKENILKFLYETGASRANLLPYEALDTINSKKVFVGIDYLLSELPLFSEKILLKRLRDLTEFGLLTVKTTSDVPQWSLTDDGRKTGAHILKLHCLWEAYLTKYLNIHPNHAHEDAESIEHILTPELEKELVNLVNNKHS